MIEKIDVIEPAVYCYDEQYRLIKTLDISQFHDVDFNYLRGAKLFTLNVTQPIKRAIKFKEINTFEIRAEFTEYPYDEMSDKEKLDFDSFIQQANDLE